VVELSIERDDLVVDVRGWSRLWTLRRRLRIPLSRIKAVRADPEALRGWWKGWRLLGTHVPGVIVAGAFHRRGGREFWDVRRGHHAVTIELESDRYRRLVVDVADPPTVVATIDEALRKGPRGSAARHTERNDR
jgi:hypothetical protein